MQPVGPSYGERVIVSALLLRRLQHRRPGHGDIRRGEPSRYMRASSAKTACSFAMFCGRHAGMGRGVVTGSMRV